VKFKSYNILTFKTKTKTIQPVRKVACAYAVLLITGDNQNGDRVGQTITFTATPNDDKQNGDKYIPVPVRC